MIIRWGTKSSFAQRGIYYDASGYLVFVWQAVSVESTVTDVTAGGLVAGGAAATLLAAGVGIKLHAPGVDMTGAAAGSSDKLHAPGVGVNLEAE